MKHNSSLRRHGTIKPNGRGITISALNPAYRAGRTIFPSRVFDVDEVARLLKDGHQSRKIGRIVQKGHLKGAPIFTLTLEERATCPRTCEAWAFCYGNRMQAAERIVAGLPLEAALWEELTDLQHAHPGGFLVRLHVLGDFYSTGYVDIWKRALIAFPALYVFGFTARLPAEPIGMAINDLITSHGRRWRIRFSGRPGDHHAARLVEHDQADAGAIPCPAQTGQTDCCATCALCWQSTRSISCARH